jgi:hypothetical protein
MKFSGTKFVRTKVFRKKRPVTEGSETLTEQNSIFHLGFVEWMFSWLYETPKMKIAEKIHDEIASHMDIVAIISKIHEIELLKSMLLDRNQRILFDNIFKPTIKVVFDETPHGNVYFDFEKDEKAKGFYNCPRLVDSAIAAIKDDPLNPINQKLIDHYKNVYSKQK